MTPPPFAKRSSIEVKVALSDAGPAASGAFTKGEGAAGGAGAGAATGLGMWGYMGEVGLAVLVFAPAVIVGTTVVGAGIGAASGAAAGTNYTREDIDKAISVVWNSFSPAIFEYEFEGMMANQLRTRISGENAPCVTTSAERRKCARTANSSVFNVNMSSRITASKESPGGGELDFVTQSTFWTDPKGALSPDCVTFLYRHPAGNLFDLATNDGAPVQASFQRMLASMSDGMADRMFPAPNTQTRKNTASAVHGAWARESCDYATRLLSSAG